ncbi:M23 family metallopeptidase [Pseudodesulfovibrio sp. zrk46]|uniref:M23 family metallopeptidase n=1 Tax=Pseudodesulfovibrio sp. zrk46 TaxID=2725288 RepID=UPI001448F829|nr:M23 family metallopeptidase [Pseudodesulfovibrio sp. zrk46]QJB57900.1 M23 family metallopeptidase [Pseudodesulfovibrio sp. zrk46]
MKKESSKSFPLILTVVIVMLALGAGAFLLFKDTVPPTIAIGPEITNVGKGSQLTITVADPGSGLKTLEIVGLQNGKTIPLINKTFPGGVMQVEEVIDLAKGQLKEGQFTIQVKTEDASLYPFGVSGVATAERAYSFDATPPRIYVQSHTNNMNQGGAGFMVYALSEEADKTGIRVGERFFPGYLQSDDNGKYLYYCLFAHPWDTSIADFKPVIEASDKAGNITKRSFNFHTNARKFRRDKINLSDRFMERTIPEFQNDVPSQKTPLEQYLYINNQIRKANRDQLLEFSRQTSPAMMWSGTFKRLPNAANRARFADARDYMYKGKKVDHQTHLGLDLASLKHAPVPAGNDGKIIYADFLGIYGNVVVIDHGLGLQTLYAHLSSISVQRGDMVAKGDIVGNTGTTGLAGGDHLHYGVIIGGTPVQPIEWWDGTWMKNNITSKLD